MIKEKSQIKNAATERMFLKVAPDHLVETYFNFFESTDPEIQARSNALATMFAAKYSEAAFNELLAFYKSRTGHHFQLYSDQPDHLTGPSKSVNVASGGIVDQRG